MSKLIDVNEAIINFGFEWDDIPPTRKEFVHFLKKHPTVDAVPVVRCRECKYLNVVNRKELYAHCPKTNTVFLPFELDTREHFCSLGERKEGANNG